MVAASTVPCGAATIMAVTVPKAYSVKVPDWRVRCLGDCHSGDEQNLGGVGPPSGVLREDPRRSSKENSRNTKTGLNGRFS